MLHVRIGRRSYQEWQTAGDATGTELESYFARYRRDVVGMDQTFISPYGRKTILYADWTASGRLYRPIEQQMLEEYGPFVANTHTESNVTGSFMTKAYKMAKEIIKRHVHAEQHDVLITGGSGMTAMVNKLQRLLGLRVPEKWRKRLSLNDSERPVIFVTHMEHHSNQLSWLETIGEVVVVGPDSEGRVSPVELERELKHFESRPLKIGAFTACSNVTGIQTPYHQLAKKMHEHGGVCFVDFAASAPYVDINMHPADPLEKLDAVYFSPHKFLGGPGTSGVLVVDSRLLENSNVPDHPGGGTVLWSNPWGGRHYHSDVELREDGGTPGFLQCIKTALCIKLKEEMGSWLMQAIEQELLGVILPGLAAIPGVHVLDGYMTERLGIVSFITEHVHYNLMVRLLNDLYGIQVRGGCSCAGTYGHYLFQMDQAASQKITDKIDQGNMSLKPGWVRISLHPTMTRSEVILILRAIQDICENIKIYEKDYVYDAGRNEFIYRKQ